MATEIVLPVLGEAIGEAVLVRWYKRAGEAVRRGEEIAELETDKATLGLECPEDGVLLALMVEEGASVHIGELLAVVGQEGEVYGGREKAVEAGEVDAALSAAAPASPFEETEQRISPAARKRAGELGVDIRQVTPSAPGARITSEDVERYAGVKMAEGAWTELPPFHIVELNEVRRITARRMSESVRTIPQFSVSVESDAGSLMRTLEEVRTKGGEGIPRVSLTALWVYLVGQVLPRHPLANARFDGERVLLFETVNLAVAVATPRGLVAPVIHAAERLTLSEAARQLEEAAGRAREGKLTPGDVSGATFTLSNLGMFGVGSFVPLVNPPQSAILGVGMVRTASLGLLEGETRPVQTVTLTLAADHRVMDGADAARFLGDLKSAIEGCSLEQIRL